MYRHLLGTTPSRKSQNNAYQFTPIGEHSDPDLSILQNGRNEPLNSAKTANIMPNSDKIDDSFETFSEPSVINTPINKENVEPRHTKFLNASNRENNQILDGISEPIAHQRNYIKKLQAESHGLKIEIAYLKKYLNSDFSTPESVKQLINENVELKSEITRLSDQLESVKQASSPKKASSPKNSNVSEFVIQINTLQNEKAELSSKITDLEHQVDQLGQDNEDNHELLTELSHKNRELEEKELEIEQLRKKCSRLEETKTSDVQDNDRLEEELIDKQREIEQLSAELDSATKSNYEAKMAASEAHKKEQSLASQLAKERANTNNLQVKLKNLQGSGSTVNKRVAQLTREIESKSQKISQLNDLVKQYEEQKTLDDSEIEKLSSYIDSLENQLNSNSSYELENEILRLRALENELRNQISQYKLDITNLKAELEENTSLMDNSVFLQNVEQIEIERDQAYNDLKVYEDHIFDLENKVQESMTMLDEAAEKYTQLEQDLISLESENNMLRRQNEYSDSHTRGYGNISNKDKSKGSRLGFLGSFWNSTTDVDTDDEGQLMSTSAMKKLNREKVDLEDEIQSLRLKIKHLSEDLETERNKSSIGTFEKEEIKRLSKQKNDLEVRLNDKHSILESQLRDSESRIYKLNEDLKSKDLEIERMMSKLKNSEGNRTSSEEVINKEEHLKLVKEGLQKEKQIMKLKFELDGMKEEFKMKSDSYSKEIETLKSSLANSVKPEEKKQLASLTEEISELKKQLERVGETSKEEEKEKKQLKFQIEELQNNLQKTRDNYEKIYEKYQKQQENLDDEKDEFLIRRQLKSKEKELKQLSASYEEMKSRLMFKIKELTSSRKNMKEDLAKLTSNLNSLDIGKPKNVHLLQNSIVYYRESYHQQLYHAQDLKFANDYLSSSLNRLNQSVANQALYMVKRGGLDVHVDVKPKINFKVVAKMVLAAVRIKNRWEKSQRKKALLQELKNDG